MHVPVHSSAVLLTCCPCTSPPSQRMHLRLWGTCSRAVPRACPQFHATAASNATRLLAPNPTRPRPLRMQMSTASSTSAGASQAAGAGMVKATSSGAASAESAAADTASRDTLMRLMWHDLRTHHIEYKGFLSNHLAHGLIALHRMGASSERLEEFERQYVKKLEPHRPADERMGTALRQSFMQHVGEGRGWINLITFFEDEWKRLEAEVTQKSGTDSLSPKALALSVDRALINEYFPHLLPYMSGAATHPLIHLGFGQSLSETDPPLWWSQDQPEQIAVNAEMKEQTLQSSPADAASKQLAADNKNPLTIAGLSYLVFRGMRLDEGTEGYTASNFQSIPHANSLSLLQAVSRAIDAFRPLLSTVETKATQEPYASMQIGKFQRKLHVVVDDAAQLLLEKDIAWQIDENRTEKAAMELHELAVLLYGLSPNDFFMLHGVTSVFALQCILPTLDSPADKVRALRYALKTVMAVYVVQGMPASDSPLLANVIASGQIVPILQEAMDAEPEHKDTEWSRILPAAIKSDGEHTQKLVWVCWRHAQQLQSLVDLDPAVKLLADWYRWCAAKRVHCEADGIENY